MAASASEIRNGVVYVSAWVLIWGTAASVADAVLLGRSAYESGSSGQVVTFVSYGIASVVLAVRLSGRFLRKGSSPEPPGEEP